MEGCAVWGCEGEASVKVWKVWDVEVWGVEDEVDVG